jgi:hypothetical protein
MSKQDNSAIDSIPANYASIHWFLDTNIRKNSYRDPLSDLNFSIENEGKDDEIVKGTTSDGLVHPLWKGWDISQGACKVVAASAADAKRAIADRQEIIARYEKNPATQPYAIVLREIWFPKGKPSEVKYVANECFRRSRGVLGVIVKRAILADYKDYDTEYKIPVVVVTFANAVEKLNSHVRENLGKDDGRSPLTEVDVFFYAKELINLNPGKAKEADLVKVGIKRGQAIKCFALATFDRKFPELNLANRILAGGKPKEKDEAFAYSPSCPLPLSKVKHENLQKLKNGWRYNDTSGDATKKVRGGVQAKHVEEYFKHVLLGMEELRTVPKADEIFTALVGSPVKLFQYLGTQLRAGNRDCLATIEANAKRINDAVKFLDLDSEEEESEEEETPAPTKSRETVKSGK